MSAVVSHIIRVVVFVSQGTVCVAWSMIRVGERRERQRAEPYGCGFVSKAEGKPGFGTHSEQVLDFCQSVFSSRKVL